MEANTNVRKNLKIYLGKPEKASIPEFQGRARGKYYVLCEELVENSKEELR